MISKAPDVRRRTRRTAIVNGGPGGLLTTSFAERAAVAPESITVYEAGPRLALVSARSNDTWRLNGLCPWGTGADSSDTIVTGAPTETGEQLFFVASTAAHGLDIAPPMQLLALSGSRTSSLVFREVEPADVIGCGPTPTASWCGLHKRR